MHSKKSCDIACSLSTAQLHKLRDELLPGLFKRAGKIDDIPNGFRLHFQNHPGLLAEIARIIEQERVCCAFLRFQFTIESNPVLFCSK